MRKTITAALAAAAIASLSVVAGCGSSAPSWCNAAEHDQVVKGEPAVIQLGIETAQVLGVWINGSNEQAATASQYAPVLKRLVANLKKDGCTS